MTTDIISTITDDAKRERAAELAALPGWSPDLAALAVLSGNEAAAAEAINSALIKATSIQPDFGAAKDQAEIALLRQKIAEAKQRGDVRRLVSLKTHLYDRYGVGSM